MQVVRLYALRSERKALLEQLQRLGVVEITDSVALDGAIPEGFTRIDREEEAGTFDRMAANARQALEILDEYAPVKKGMLASFAGRREVSAQEFSACAEKSREVMAICAEIQALRKKAAEGAAELVRIRSAQAQLEPWMRLDVPLRFTGTAKTTALIGTLPGTFTTEGLYAALDAEGRAFACEILSASAEQTCVFLLCPKGQAQEMEQALRALGFARPPALGGGVPQEEYAALERAQEAALGQADEIREKLAGLAEHRGQIEMTADYYTVRAEKYRMIGRLDHSRSTFVVSGYVPEAAAAQLTETLEGRFTVVVQTEPADPEKAPVLLKNNAFAAPAESITEMYAMPNAQDIDPTPLMSFFYYLFFGMMLSDAGYGLLLFFGSWFLMRKYRPEAAMRRNLKLFMYCGVSTVLWGLVFGSFFGDAPTVIAKTFFGVDFAMPKLLDPITDAVTLLVLSLILGLLQILVGLGAKFYMLWRSGDKAGAVFDVGFWMTALLGFGILAGGMVSAPVLTTIGGVVAAVSLLGLVCTQGRKKKGPMKVLSGLASLYDVTGYVSDLMSYSRLMALGLTTGVMGTVFNMLGAMFGRSIAGAFAMLVIFLVGHGINFGINALGAYVHTIRLQYVELFGKFYEGGGRKFQPFAFHSQYVRIKEEKEV